MRRLIVCVLAVSLASSGAALADRKRDEAVGAIIGGILGGIVAAERAKQERERRSRGQTYRAQGGATCFPRQRECYIDGRYSPRVTQREFGYR